MKNKQILQNIAADKAVSKAISKLSYYSPEQFIQSVSNSGMSRVIKFTSCEGSPAKGFGYRQYICLFRALGFSEAKKQDGFRINGCLELS